jgi:hypothetical protein
MNKQEIFEKIDELVGSRDKFWNFLYIISREKDANKKNIFGYLVFYSIF